jgi:hypothetical protein
MPNHFHLIIQVQQIPLSTIMRSALTSFAKYFNRTRHKIGHVFQGRYRAILCQKESYLLELVRYIHLNPVRAHLVDSPQQWRWCSLASYLHPSQHPWLYTKDVLAHFGQRPRHHLLAFLSQAPAVDPAAIYRPESFPLLGDAEFVKLATAPVPLRRQVTRSFPGPRFQLPKIARVCADQSHLPVSLLETPHKGSAAFASLTPNDHFRRHPLLLLLDFASGSIFPCRAQFDFPYELCLLCENQAAFIARNAAVSIVYERISK